MNEGYSKFDIYVFDIRFSFVFIFLTKTITSFWNVPSNTKLPQKTKDWPIISFLCSILCCLSWVFSLVRVAQSLVFCAVFCRSLLVFYWGTCCSIFSFLCSILCSLSWVLSVVLVTQSLVFCVVFCLVYPGI